MSTEDGRRSAGDTQKGPGGVKETISESENIVGAAQLSTLTSEDSYARKNSIMQKDAVAGRVSSPWSTQGQDRIEVMADEQTSDAESSRVTNDNQLSPPVVTRGHKGKKATKLGRLQTQLVDGGGLTMDRRVGAS